MRPVAPRVAYQGQDMPEIGCAEDQPEYMPITITPIYHGDGTVTVLTRWKPTPEERTAIANGADIYVGTVHAEGYLMNPLMVSVDPKIWNVEAQRDA